MASPETWGVDETSVENVLADLTHIDEELRDADKLEPPHIGKQYPGETGDTVGLLPELSEQSLKTLTADIKNVWTRLGLADPRNFTVTKLQELRSEILLQLDVYTAEILYFDTAKKTWQKLGSETVTTDRLMAQLQPPEDPSKPARGVELNKLRSEQRMEALGYLKGIGIDGDQLFSMMIGPPPQQQNIVRLSYVLSEEPALKELREVFVKRQSNDLSEPLKFEEVVDMIVRELVVFIRCYIAQRRRMAATQKLESIDYEQYDRAMGCAKNSLNLIGLIRQDMSIE